MRCTGCGLPLSPKHTHCLRCGKAVGEAGKQGKKADNYAETPQYASSSPHENNNMPTSVDALQGQLAFPSQQQANNAMSNQPFNAPGIAQSPGQANQMRLPDPNRTLSSRPEQAANQKASEMAGRGNQAFPYSYQRPEQTRRPTLQPGFAIAGLCVIAGGLILMFVYIISLNLPAPGKQSLATSTSTPITQNLAPGSQGTPAITATTQPTTAPTPNLPGQVYIDKAQTASGIDTNTAQATQLTTTFKVHQQIFVTFQLHPNNGGEVCLLWYINQKQFSHFEFPVTPITGPQNAYSYNYISSTGQGTVEIYWASSKACTDKVKAQVVNFSVTP